MVEHERDRPAKLGAAVSNSARDQTRNDELAGYSHVWNEYAIEYIEMAMDATREWRDASAKLPVTAHCSVASSVRLPGFN